MHRRRLDLVRPDRPAEGVRSPRATRELHLTRSVRVVFLEVPAEEIGRRERREDRHLLGVDAPHGELESARWPNLVEHAVPGHVVVTVRGGTVGHGVGPRAVEIGVVRVRRPAAGRVGVPVVPAVAREHPRDLAEEQRVLEARAEGGAASSERAPQRRVGGRSRVEHLSDDAVALGDHVGLEPIELRRERDRIRRVDDDRDDAAVLRVLGAEPDRDRRALLDLNVAVHHPAADRVLAREAERDPRLRVGQRGSLETDARAPLGSAIDERSDARGDGASDRARVEGDRHRRRSLGHRHGGAHGARALLGVGGSLGGEQHGRDKQGTEGGESRGSHGSSTMRDVARPFSRPRTSRNSASSADGRHDLRSSRGRARSLRYAMAHGNDVAFRSSTVTDEA